MAAATAKIKKEEIKGGGTCMTGGRIKRKSFQLYNLGDVFLWNTDTNLPKNLKWENWDWVGQNLKHGIGRGDFSRTECVCV
jgi:hypothetical protein